MSDELNEYIRKELTALEDNPEGLRESNIQSYISEVDAAAKIAAYENLLEEAADLFEELKSGLDNGSGASEAKLGRLAQCNDRWLKIRKRIRSARSDAYTARANARSADKTWRTVQSNMSYLKEGMKRDIV